MGKINIYINQCNLNKRIWLAWFRLRTQTVRSKRRGAEIGRFPLCNKEENVVHVFLKCNEVKRRSEKLLDNKWSYINE